jgi:hypothetical protein
MKAVYKKWLSLMLVIQVLIAAVGLPVYSHTCKVMGLTELSVFEENGCCSKEKPVTKPMAAVDDSCCDLSVDHVHADFDAVFSTIANFCFAAFTYFQSIALPEWPSLAITETVFLQHSDSSPPKLHGRMLLHFIQILII